MAMSVAAIADAMFKEVEEATKFGKKLKPMDLTKSMIKAYEAQGVDKKLCKEAIKELVDHGRLVYTYFGGSFLELPHREGAAND